MIDYKQKEALAIWMSNYTDSWLSGLMNNSWNNKGVITFSLVKTSDGGWMITGTETYEQQLATVPRTAQSETIEPIQQNTGEETK